MKILYKILLFCFLILTFVLPAFSGQFAFIDLKPKANSKILNTSWWTGNAGGSDLEELYEKAKDGAEFEGPGGEKIPFKVENACLVIYGTNSAGNPKKIEGIKVDMKAESIYFLHMTGWQQEGIPSYKFVMNYGDGSKQELLMQSHINSDDWCHIPAQLNDKNSKQIWIESGVTCGQVSVIATKWENPSKAKTIKTIDFVSLETAAVPGLFAITLGGASAAIIPLDRLIVTWASIKTNY